jgi:catechol 2,3-dioxygenase-like lactoylglutathione lyase family enzyme
MVRHPDHVTVAVRDAAAARAFFELLGFREDKSVVIAGSPFDTYMGVPGIEAEHRTLVLQGAEPRFEIQLLTYRQPAVHTDATAGDLARTGFNHICFAVDDLDAEVARLSAAGVQLRNRVMLFHDRKLVFLAGPEGVVIELAQWVSRGASSAFGTDGTARAMSPS